ncbi:hypothetical protein BDA99DRAFT_541694 [Phascolomyces articulosus]|uniref:Uncharacterized protein n=1 Tax=Phascolomyces articulosus TaxID=60185 RepID=A0AAD5JRI0_9FUNG|nr:hypothetical protein BDA99DRAFT_541694 [Phascolomyces articulosus]
MPIEITISIKSHGCCHSNSSIGFISILDLRAHVLRMKCHFSKAIYDFKEIIRYAPIQAIGYLRLGQLFSMQEKQSTVIPIYEETLTKGQRCLAYTEPIQGKQSVNYQVSEKLENCEPSVINAVDEVCNEIYKYLHIIHPTAEYSS